jgi:hypothetical protein
MTTVGAQNNNTLFLYAWLAMPAFGVDLGPNMPIKAPPLKAPALPLFTWTGCYAGGQVAGAWGNKDLTDTTEVVATSTGFTSVSLNINGYVLGGQVGCDNQFGSNWVLGIEGALAGGDISASTGVAQPLGIPGDTATFKETTNYLSSVTGRLDTHGIAGCVTSKGERPGRATSTTPSGSFWGRRTISRASRPGSAGRRALALNGRFGMIGRSSSNTTTMALVIAT